MQSQGSIIIIIGLLLKFYHYTTAADRCVMCVCLEKDIVIARTKGFHNCNINDNSIRSLVRVC